jgi:Uma2 family endonuclease
MLGIRRIWSSAGAPGAGLALDPEPVPIVEVLSPSTAQHDRGTKLFDYREIPSVQEILLVSSEARRVEIWRHEGARWIVETLIGDAELRLAAVAESIPLSAIYENVAA